MIPPRMTTANADESYPPILEGFVAPGACEHAFAWPQPMAGPHTTGPLPRAALTAEIVPVVQALVLKHLLQRSHRRPWLFAAPCLWWSYPHAMTDEAYGVVPHHPTVPVAAARVDVSAVEESNLPGPRGVRKLPRRGHVQRLNCAVDSLRERAFHGVAAPTRCPKGRAERWLVSPWSRRLVRAPVLCESDGLLGQTSSLKPSNRRVRRNARSGEGRCRFGGNTHEIPRLYAGGIACCAKNSPLGIPVRHPQGAQRSERLNGCPGSKSSVEPLDTEPSPGAIANILCRVRDAGQGIAPRVEGSRVVEAARLLGGGVERHWCVPGHPRLPGHH